MSMNCNFTFGNNYTCYNRRLECKFKRLLVNLNIGSKSKTNLIRLSKLSKKERILEAEKRSTIAGVFPIYSTISGCPDESAV